MTDTKQPEFKSQKFINSIIESEEDVTVFLSNGVKLQGRIVGADEEEGRVFAFFLSRDGTYQLVLMPQVATILRGLHVVKPKESDF